VGALKFIGRGYQMRITTRDDGPLDCEFCGQCVAVCPVGALLPRPFKHKARVWDLEPTTTVCGYCGAGCQLVMHTLRDRIQPRHRRLEIRSTRASCAIAGGRFGLGDIVPR
jgi:NADH dehydrogenase/NADH:ubiquinone oxidoreductase subunit G